MLITSLVPLSAEVQRTGKFASALIGAPSP